MIEVDDTDRIQIQKLTKMVIEHEVSLTKINNIVLLDAENLSVCSHGIPIKFVCKECAAQHIDSLMNNRNDQEYKKQVERLTEIVVSHEEYLRKIDTIALIDADKVSRNFSELEHLIKHAQDGIEKCFDRIERIEKMLINVKNENQYRLQIEEFYKNRD